MIKLDQPWIAAQAQELLSPPEQHRLTLKLLATFTGQTTASIRSVEPQQARRELYSLLIQAPPFHFSESELSAIDQLLASEQHL